MGSGDGEHIPRAFAERILLHVFKNHVPAVNPPLLLAVQGPMGAGKSWQTRRVCERYKITVEAVSGAELSGEHEKASVETFTRAYLRAATKPAPSVLLIDDFHLSVASTFDDRHYTVNSQLLVGALMNLADDPTACGTAKVRRTPVILTGNDFTALYAPLTRHGRMEFFDWQPTTEDKAAILRGLLARVLVAADLDRTHVLAERFPDEPVAFFSSLTHRLYDSVVLDWLGGTSARTDELQKLLAAPRQFTLEQVLRCADEAAAARARNFTPTGDGERRMP